MKNILFNLIPLVLSVISIKISYRQKKYRKILLVLSSIVISFIYIALRYTFNNDFSDYTYIISIIILIGMSLEKDKQNT